MTLILQMGERCWIIFVKEPWERKRIQALPRSTRRGHKQSLEMKRHWGTAINSVEVLQGEMIYGNAAHLLKESDIFLGAWQGIYFQVCLRAALISQEVCGKINAC